MCNLEVVSQKGGICWTYTIGHHEEGPNGKGQYICSLGVRIRDTIFARDGKKFTDTMCPTRGPWFGKFII